MKKTKQLLHAKWEKTFLASCSNLAKAQFFIFLKIYRLLFSPAFAAMGVRCRFTPTCSHYSEEAVREWGFLRGIRLSFMRVGRCHPLCVGGHDPVPMKK